MPSARSLALGAGFVGFVALQGLAAAQPSSPEFGLGFGERIAIGFLARLIVNLLLGGALVALGPRYSKAMVTELRDDPGGAFGWGLLAGLVAPVALVLLGLTIVGLVITIPGLVVLFALGVVGNAVTIAWIGTGLTGDDVDGSAVGVGAVALALVGALPLLGGFLTTVLGLFGLGVVSRTAYQSRRGDDSGGRTKREREAPRRRHDL